MKTFKALYKEEFSHDSDYNLTKGIRKDFKYVAHSYGYGNEQTMHDRKGIAGTDSEKTTHTTILSRKKPQDQGMHEIHIKHEITSEKGERKHSVTASHYYTGHRQERQGTFYFGHDLKSHLDTVHGRYGGGIGDTLKQMKLQNKMKTMLM